MQHSLDDNELGLCQSAKSSLASVLAVLKSKIRLNECWTILSENYGVECDVSMQLFGPADERNV